MMRLSSMEFWPIHNTIYNSMYISDLPTPKVTFRAVNATSVLIHWNGENFYSVKSYRLNVQKLLESSSVKEINISSKSSEYLLTNLGRYIVRLKLND